MVSKVRPSIFGFGVVSMGSPLILSMRLCFCSAWSVVRRVAWVYLLGLGCVFPSMLSLHQGIVVRFLLLFWSFSWLLIRVTSSAYTSSPWLFSSVGSGMSAMMTFKRVGERTPPGEPPRDRSVASMFLYCIPCRLLFLECSLIDT